MARSLGLAAYRALTRRGEVAQDIQSIPRPIGELAWIHAGDPANLLSVQDLALRLAATRQDLSVLITLPEDAAPQAQARDVPDVIQIATPGEHPSAVKAFLDHWQPDACIWVWGGLRPNLVLDTAARGCPMFLVDADVAGFDQRRDRWLPELPRRMLSKFSAIFARSPAGYKRIAQFGLGPDRLEQTSALLAGGQVLGCRDRDLTDLSAAMGGRPAWFATSVPDKEIPIVLAAHTQALRLSHRLLLIMQPTEPDALGLIADFAQDRGMSVVNWDDGQFPDDTTQMMVTTEAAARGLFFRVAPVSFLGGTLLQDGSSTDPLEAAALGSAILYGPRVRQFMPSYSRLATAGAARIVNDAGALGTAVSRLIAPDQAAAMAHAGWDVISEGAALTDKIIERVQDALDTGLLRS